MAANQNVMGGVNDTALVWLQGVRLSRTARAIVTRVDVEIL